MTYTPLIQQGKAINGQILCEEISQYFSSLLDCFPLSCKSFMPLQPPVFPQYCTVDVTQVLTHSVNDYKCLSHNIMFPLY
jgi:hypothetical protein